MRVLITCHSLGFVGGTQVYVRDLAAWLVWEGHTPIVYGPNHGQAAAQLERLTVPVTGDVFAIGAAPDIIHGNSTLETMAAVLHFQDTPAIFVCHGWYGDLATAPRVPQVLRYVAVDDTCADRLLFREGVPSEKVCVILNAVDLRRFRPRTAPLPPRPRRAVVFGNTAHAANHSFIVEQACHRAGIEVDVIGVSAGTSIDAPEEVLGGYDLIFAKGKCALEGMASGAAVILCDTAGVGGMVTSTNAARLRKLNFGIRALDQPVTVQALSQAIAAYDPVDAGNVSRLIRRTASSEVQHEQIFSLYEAVIAEHRARARTDWQEEKRALAVLMQSLSRANRASERQMSSVVQAAHRLLRAPLVGPLLSRVAGWILKRGKRGR